MPLCSLRLAIAGEAEDCGEGEALLGIRQAVVERVPGDPTVPSVQAGQDLCPGSSDFFIQLFPLLQLIFS